MTPQEAYLTGLTNAETLVIEKLQALINKTETTPFNNPELEVLRVQLIELLEVKPIIPTTSVDFLEKIENLILYKRLIDLPESDNVRENNIIKALTLITDYIWVVIGGKTTAAKYLRRIFTRCQKILS